jgi:ElaB/YqjD/DUF883 family membrane-anchored ribosome-binding protein
MSVKIEDKRINEALDLLNELAKEKKSELEQMISEKYGELKSAFGGTAETIKKQAHEVYEHAAEKAKSIASEVDKSVRKNPWPYLGGTALGFLIIGFFLGRPKR